MVRENTATCRWRRLGLAVHVVALAVSGLGAHSSARADDVPPAGGLEALPQPRTVAVPLANGGFEDGTEGWHFAKDGPFQVTRSAKRTGQASLRFDAAVPFKYTPSVRQAIHDARPGVYRLRFWIRTRDIRTPQRGTAGVRVSIEYQLADGARRRAATKVFQGTADWQAVELGALLPADMKGSTATISVHRYNIPPAGEAYFDDFAIERLADPPVEAYLLYPNYRGYLAEDGPQKVRLRVKVNDAEASAPASLEVTDAATGRRTASVTAGPGKKEQIIELDAAKWPVGRYAVRARLGDYACPAYLVQKISADQRRRLAIWFDEHNVLHAHGRPVFPLGLYNTTREFDVVDDGEIARLDEMTQAPVNFNINYWWWPSTTATRRRYISEMHKRGIWYLDTVMPFKPGKARYSPEKFLIANELLPSAGGKLDTDATCDRFLTLLAKRMRQIPGHAGWYVMDERPFDMVPSIFHQYTVLRSADPDHPTYGVSNRADEIHKWRDALDVFGMDPYPLMNMKAGRPLSLVARETRVAVEATHHSRPVWMVLQFFQGWSTDRWPTAEELRTMSLMAVTEGARGLLYWSFGSRALMSVKDAGKKAEYWQRLVSVTKELKSLEPALLAPDAPEIVSAVSDPRVRWRGRQAGGKWYVFAYLPAERFSERAEGKCVEVTLTMKDGRKVQHTFRPDTAHWFAVSARPR